MARTGISKEQVFEAASALLEEGTAATVQAVRERIGSGSYTTVTRHLDEWRKEHAGQAPTHIPDMPEKVMGAFHQVWATAAKAAQEDVDTQRQALEAMRREMEQDKADMAAEIARLEKALDEAGGRGERQAEELAKEREARAEKDERITALTVENARLDERVKAAKGRGDELKGQLERLEDKLAAQTPKSRQPRRAAKPKTTTGRAPAPAPKKKDV